MFKRQKNTGIRQAHKLVVKPKVKGLQIQSQWGTLNRNLWAEQLLQTFHTKALECLIKMDVMGDAEQTEAHLATLTGAARGVG